MTRWPIARRTISIEVPGATSMRTRSSFIDWTRPTMPAAVITSSPTEIGALLGHHVLLAPALRADEEKGPDREDEEEEEQDARAVRRSSSAAANTSACSTGRALIICVGMGHPLSR